MSVPLDLGVFRDLFVALAEEMGVALQRTAYSPNVVERRDYSCALYDASGTTIAMGDHMPVHLGSMSLSVAAARRTLDLSPGDVAMVNEPASGGTHLPDLTLVRGVWLDGEEDAAFWLANRAHHADVGGRSAGSMPLTTDVYEEGVVFPPVPLMRQDDRVERIWRHLLRDVRTPEEREGDLAAQLASLATGERRLRALVERYGHDRLREMGTALVEYAARLVRALLDEVPDGTYGFEDVLDDDGMGAESPTIRVTIEVEGNAARVDFDGTDPALEGPLNANPAIVRSAVFYVLRTLLEEDAPANDGILQPVEIAVPGGSLLDPGWGSPVAAGNVETSQRVVDVLLGALAGAIPGRIPAASQGTMNNLAFGGTRAGGRPFTYYETVAGGAGGHPDGPGADGLHTHMTNSLNTPVEALERDLPVRVWRYAYRTGSGGDGRHPGGEGVVREIEALAALDATILSDRRTRGPWGLRGGADGSPGRNRRIRSDGSTEELPGKVETRIEVGERISIETPGGGGWGEPDEGLGS